MFIPISDYPPSRGAPWMTIALIVVNVAVYLLVTLPLSAERPAPNDPLLREYIRAIGSALPPNVPLQAVLAEISRYDLFVFAHGFRPAAPSESVSCTRASKGCGAVHAAAPTKTPAMHTARSSVRGRTRRKASRHHAVASSTVVSRSRM